MSPQTYNLGFTASSLRLQDSLKIAELYLAHKDWNIVRDQVINDNRLQQRTVSSSKRLYQELSARLMHLTDDELFDFVKGSRPQKDQLLWAATCRHYPFLQEFYFEVVKEHIRNLNYQLDYADFDIYFNSKLDFHDELNELSDTTKRKIRQVTFRMLREADLLSPQNVLNPASAILQLTEADLKQHT